MRVDPTGRIFGIDDIIFWAVVGAYLGGSVGNNYDFNPAKWDYHSANTWLGIGIGALAGGGIGALSDAGVINTSFNLKLGDMTLVSSTSGGGISTTSILGTAIGGGSAAAYGAANAEWGQIHEIFSDIFGGASDDVMSSPDVNFGGSIPYVTAGAPMYWFPDEAGLASVNWLGIESGDYSTYYLNEALQYTGTPYARGGHDPSTGIDCSYLVCLATGSSWRWTTRGGMPPGSWSRVYPDVSSPASFESSLTVGNLLVWPSDHAAFYVGNGGMFHAHGPSGTPQAGTDFTWDLERYLFKHGYPNVYQETGR